MRSSPWLRSLLALPLLLAFPAIAHAVTSSVTVTAGGEPLPGQTIEIVDTSGEVVAEGTTGEDGSVGFDLPPGGSYRARTPDGKNLSAPFPAGKSISLALPAPAAEPEEAPSDHAWTLALDLGGGYTSQDSSTHARGVIVSEEVRPIEEVPLDPEFPDAPVEFVTVRRTTPFAFSSGSAVAGGFGSASLQVLAPNCGCLPFGLRPILFGGVPFDSIDDTLLAEDVAGTGSRVELEVDRWFWNIALGLALPLGHGFGLEGALMYQNDRVRLHATLNPRASETEHIHSLGPRLALTKRLLRRGRFELGAFAGVAVLFPIGDDDASVAVGSGPSRVAFEWEASTQVTAVGGLRLAFDLPGR